jgi:bacteriorhodopsin
VLLAQLFTAAVPWQHGLFIIFTEWFAVVSGLAGAFTESNYKWGYFVFSLVALFYIIYSLAIPARRHASAVGPEVLRTYHTGGGLLLLVALLYPICWGVSEGGNVITPDGEAVFYGILDIILFGVYGLVLLVGHNSVDPDSLGLQLRDYDEGFGSSRYEKGGAAPAVAAEV